MRPPAPWSAKRRATGDLEPPPSLSLSPCLRLPKGGRNRNSLSLLRRDLLCTHLALWSLLRPSSPRGKSSSSSSRWSRSLLLLPFPATSSRVSLIPKLSHSVTAKSILRSLPSTVSSNFLSLVLASKGCYPCCIALCFVFKAGTSIMFHLM